MGSLGDLHPQIAIALELQKRSHEILFATHKEYRSKIASLGLKFHRIRPDYPLNDLQESERMMDLRSGTRYVFDSIFRS
jgi:UDP:flavonoid glycosyltransferase YjiC (YdhE family)